MPSLRKFTISAFFLFLMGLGNAQNFEKDLVLIAQNATAQNSETTLDQRKAGLKPGRKINYINPLYWVMRGAMFSYQNAISPQISANCMFRLSCSNYSKAAFAEGGIFLGLLMSADRLTRCTHDSAIETPGFCEDENGKLIDEPQFYLKKY